MLCLAVAESQIVREQKGRRDLTNAGYSVHQSLKTLKFGIWLLDTRTGLPRYIGTGDRVMNHHVSFSKFILAGLTGD